MTTLDEKGRCCGRKPMKYMKGMRGHPYLFCYRCDREFDLNGNQIEGWAWKKVDGEFVPVSFQNRLNSIRSNQS